MLENKGLVRSTNSDHIDAIKINNDNVGNYRLPTKKVGNSGFLRFFKKDNTIISLYTDSNGRVFIHEKITLGNNEHPKDKLQEDKWRQVSNDKHTILRESDIKNRIRTRAIIYDPRDVENRINNKALASQYDDYFKRDEENRAVDGHTLNIPKVEMYWTGIYFVKDKKPNTSYAIYYRTPQSNQVGIFAHWYRAGNDTPIYVGNYKNENHEDILIRQHAHRPTFSSPGNYRGLVMTLDTVWRHYGNHGSNFTIGLPGTSRDTYVNPNAQMSGFPYGNAGYPGFYFPAYKNMIYNNPHLEGWVNTARQLHFQYLNTQFTFQDGRGASVVASRSGGERGNEGSDKSVTFYFRPVGDQSFGVWWRGE